MSEHTKKRKRLLLIARLGVIATTLAALGVVSSPAKATATTITLTNGNSEVDYNVVPPIDTTKPGGLYKYSVDGVNQVNTAVSFFRTPSGAGSTSDNRLGTLKLVSVSQAANSYTSEYLENAANSRFRLDFTSTLQGGDPGSGTSILQSVTKITNLSGQSLSNFAYFTYTDYDLNNTPNGDTASAGLGLGTTINAQQTEPNGTEADSSVNLTARSGVTRRYEVNNASTLLGELNSGTAYNLNNSSGPLDGDVATAFEYTFPLAATGLNSSVQITQQRTITGVPQLASVPEPSVALGFLTLGGLMLACQGCRKRSFLNS
ncbi:MAG: PEP-CTERM sorting domain-containing protein [Chroococcidiopsidaceae cyanobacterium CP_BM_RX_35]|nr:PEP-CTERM sorting domain-containing protein [Chroococcidiopsidaceae cyanobacterium CP_BM_RX_35]